MRLTWIRTVAAMVCGLVIGSGLLQSQSILRQLPEKIDPKARYLFYLHGRIVQDQQNPRPRHERFGFYEYDKILQALSNKGFVVISEIRPRDATVDGYGQKVADQVRTLIKAGAAPQRITVVGASMGGAIALFASGYLHNPDVNFVFLAACSEEVFTVLDQQRLSTSGNVLSIHESSDDSTQPCEAFFKARASKTLSRTRSIELHTGLGHGFLYRPLPEWLDPAIAWANEMAAAKKE